MGYYQDLLPIGSVVLLKGGEKELSFRNDFLDQLPELVVRDGQMVPKEEA